MKSRCYTAASSCLTRTAVPSGGNPGEADSDRRKELFGTVIDYEILLMLDPELPEERQSEIVTRTRELIEKGGGTWDAHDVWGRRKLAYEIDHKPDGAYHLLTFSAEPETLDEVSRVLKITDGVMRHMAVRRSGRGPAGTVAPPSEDRQDASELPATVAVEEE
jgi:small subunit ribosomal protein S6